LTLGILEAVIGYHFGVRFAFPFMLFLVIVVLIFRPAGLFGKREVTRS
jgi:branched-subunit amino acid ABC-type transport system permease component